MANVPVQLIRADHLLRPVLSRPPRVLRRPVNISEPKPVVKELSDAGPPSLSDLDLRTAGRHLGGGRKMGWRPAVIYEGGAGFRAAPEPITPDGWAPNRYPPGHPNRHLLDVALLTQPTDRDSSRLVTHRKMEPTTNAGTIEAIRRHIIVQLGQRPYDVTPAGFRASGVTKRKNPPPGGLFGVIPSILDRLIFSFREGYGTPFAHGNIVWKRRPPGGAMTSTTSLKTQYRQRAPHRYRLTMLPTPGVNPTLDVDGNVVEG